MNISLRQLQTFTNIERHGSFVQAAQSMCVTQAALSHQLRELEDTLGFRLFHRTTRSLRLTGEGEIFLTYAKRILTNLESAVQCAAALSRGERGVLRISTTETLASTHVMSAVASFQESNRGIEVDIVEALSDGVIDDILQERADIAVGPERPLPDGSIQSDVLFNSRIVALCSRTHALAARDSVTWRELKDYPLLMVKGGARLSIARYINNAVALDSAREISHFTTLMAQAAIGKHVGITTAYVEPFLPVYGLKAIPLTRPVMERRVMLYTLRKFDLSQAAIAFISHLKRSLHK